MQLLGIRFDGEAMWGVKSIILITVLVFAGQVWIGQMRYGQGMFDALMKPTILEALRFGAVHSSLVLREPWRLVSAVFVHFGAWHLLANLFFLTWLGRVAEPAIGCARFVLAYIVTGIAGFVLSILYSILFDAFGEGVTAGASGAVFGITGMVLGLLYRQKNPQWKTFAVQAVAFQLLAGFVINRARAGIMINNLAHLGGLLVGLAFGVVFATRQPRSRDWSRAEFVLNVSALGGLLFCLIALVLAQKSPLWRELEISATGG